MFKLLFEEIIVTNLSFSCCWMQLLPVCLSLYQTKVTISLHRKADSLHLHLFENGPSPSDNQEYSFRKVLHPAGAIEWGRRAVKTA